MSTDWNMLKCQDHQPLTLVIFTDSTPCTAARTVRLSVTVSLALLYTAEVERIVQVIDSGAHGNEYTPGILVCQVISDMVRNIWCSY